MSMSTEDKIRHYQRSIDRSLLNKARLLHCIEMLGKLPVTVNHLQITGVGRTVNALRKIEDGVGDAAKVLVNKWKTMVANHVDTSEDEDEACVPDVPECYESPDCDSEPDNEVNQRENNVNQNQSEAFRSVISPPLVVDTEDIADTLPSSSTDHREEHSDDEPETLPNKSSSSRHSSSSLDHSTNKSKQSKKDSESKSSHKDKSSSSHSSKSSHNTEVNDLKKRNKNKSESSSSSHKDKKHSDDRKRKYESSSSDRESDKKKRRASESEDEEPEEENEVDEEDNVSMQGERSEEEVAEEEIEDCKEEVKEKSKEKHHSSSSKHSKSKSHESRSKSKKDKRSSKSDGRGKEENNKSEERSKESSKSKSSHSSSSSKDHSKDRDKDKHSKDKHKESSSKSHKDEKDRSSKKEIKDDRGKSKEQEKKDKESKESKHHKEHKEDKEHKEHKEKKKPKITDGGIDCNSGTSFADALGMCTIPPPKKKKESSSKSSKDSPSLNSTSTSTSTSTSSSSSSTSHSKSTSNKSSVKVKSTPPESAESLSLLSSNVKLDPLNRLDEEVDLALTLPEPSPYYKPLPHVNHVQRRQDEDQMLSQVIYAKNQRTKVYSGNKASGYTSVPSLYEMCIRILIDNIDALEFTGGVPYFIIKPVLERATADQLFILEHHNPYLIEDSDPLWQFHCNKDFRTHKREEMETWREMYLRCLDEREAKLKALTANIKQSIDKSQPVRSTKLAYVDNIVKPPRSVLRKQAKYGTANSSTSASDLKKKLITRVAGNSGGSSNSNSSSASSAERISVPPPPIARSRPPSSSAMKKTKAPLMAKALQAIKGRYKR